MKRIEAIIRPHKLQAVLTALAKAGYKNATVFESRGLTQQIGCSRIYEPVQTNPETETGLICKRLLLLFVEDNQCQDAVKLIQKESFTGKPGDGIIAVSSVEQIVRIRPE
mgnify:CR=1 FL=1